VAYADGAVSPQEATTIDALALELGFAPALVVETRELIKDQLIMQIARSSNLEALKSIAQKL
jgi:hypothetical protein